MGVESVSPGAVSEPARTTEDGKLVPQRAARCTSADIHRALFEVVPGRRTLAALKKGIRTYMRRKHGRR